MSKKSKKRIVPSGPGRVFVLGADPKMSEVILDLADPLIDGDVSDAKEVDLIVQLTIAAWNKAMLSADKQDASEKEIIDILVPRDGDAELVGTVIQALDIVEERRKKLFPNLRRFIVDYDLQVSDGRVALNIISSEVADAHEKGIVPNKSADRGGKREKP
jgi:hypothetical protein